MFCPKCGSENLDDNKFCKKCGKNLPSRAQGGQTVSQVYAMPQASNLLGQILDGRYRIEAKLGSGGMGDVYRATRLLVGDSIAVKILHPHLASDAQSAERFRREAVTATRLRHRNIVAIYDVGISAVHSLPYILMEIAEGFTLRQIINQYRTLPLEFIVTVTTQICSALEEAHSFGIVHRDIKPENIIVHQTANGWQVKVLDFGIAKLYDGSAEEDGLTLDGSAMGTPQYMSPEQCMGDALDARSDIYSVGIVLYEMLCGTVPFKSAAASAIAIFQVQNQPAPPRSVNENIHPQIETVVLRVLAKQREMRPQTAQSLAQELIQAATSAYKEGYTPNQNIVVTPSDLKTVSTNAPPENKFTPSHTLSSELLIEKEAANDSSELALTEFVEITAPKQAKIIDENRNKEVLAQTEKLPIDEEKTRSFIETENKSSDSEMNIHEVSPENKAELSHVFEDSESLLDEFFVAGKEKPGESEEISAKPEKFKSFDANQPIAVPNEPLIFHTNNDSSPQAETQVISITTKPKSNNKAVLVVGGIAAAILVLIGATTGLFWFLSGEKSAADTAIATNSSAQNTTLNSPSQDSMTKTNDSTTDRPPTIAAPDGMVYIVGGEFLLGSNTGDEYSRPAHKVVVEPFFIDLTEVTNEDYKKFLDESGRKPPPDWKNGTFPDGKARFPVTGVNWDGANAYAKWAGKRLPSEEEWEFAAKGTNNWIYPWGNDWKPELANADNQRKGMQEVGRAQGKSPFGLFDTSGNAWEWTSSDAKAYPKGENFDVNLVEPKIIRGGYWGSSPKVATATGRRAYGARGEQDGYANTSFRCVKNVSEK